MRLKNSKWEQTLALFEERFSIIITDVQGTVLYVNNVFCELITYNKTQLIGQSYKNINFYLDEHEEQVAETLFSGDIWKGEGMCHTKNGTEKWFYFVVLPIFNDDNNIEQFIVIGNDMTDHKLLESVANETYEELSNVKNALDEASIVAITDSEGYITYVNEKFCEISKFNESELVGKTHRIINSRHHPRSFFKTMWETITQGKIWNGEIKNRAKDGSYYWVNTTIVPIFNKEGNISQYISIRTDITARIKAETELARVLEDDFRKIVQNLQNWVFKVVNDKNNLVVLLSEGKLAEKLGLITDKVKGQTLYDLFDTETASYLKTYFQKALNGEVVKFETRYKGLYIYITLSPVQNDEKVTEVVGSIIDITDRKKAEDTIYYMAHYDSLTGLANREYFVKLLTDAVDDAKDCNKNLCVMFIDLDRFKNINDSLGHSTGDAVLKKVANQLRHTLSEHDVASRLGGDEFTVLIPNTSRSEAEGLAKKIVDVFSTPLALSHSEFYITPSIGVSMYPADGHTEEELIKNADAAMLLAKEQGGNNYQFYTKELQKTISTKLRLENDLRQAIEKDELELYYQPKMDIIRNKIIGLEALIRWNHPEQGLIPPNQFIPIAEETGLIIEIGEWVIQTACEQMKLWQEAGYQNLTVAVNISLRQFLQKNLYAVIKKILEKTKLESNYLELEITESIALNTDYTISTLKAMKDLGIAISIDDFGTGYSSLSYLSKFPVDKLKIDQSFVRNLDSTNQSIIKAIINIAHNLNIKVIAEGVEEWEQIEFLREHMCTQAQGYYFSKPLSSSMIDKFLKDNFYVK